MKKTLVLFLLLWINAAVFGQSERVYTWDQALKADKDSVIRLDASKQKWTSLPGELFRFKNLEVLDISKNRLVNLPEEITGLTKLKDIDISKNQIDNLPVQFCKMTALTHLRMNRNQISTLPVCIKYLQSLEYIDLWDNPVSALPSELVQLKSLKKVDLRGILFNAKFQEQWRTNMPETVWLFDYPCKCLD